MGRTWRRSIPLASALLVAAAGPDPFRPGNSVTQLDLLGDGTQSMMIVGKLRTDPP